ncbi:MAG: holo-ACP synthase [Planctomycetia bacterium]|nr:holo-ACP synthase [Planctomycetia bacterium]
MRIVGIGVDSTEIDRVVRLYQRYDDSFRARVFTEHEREYCLARRKGFEESLAARWAAKEAALKALGVGWSQGIGWTDVETRNAPSGQPYLALYGRAKELAEELGVCDIKLSLTHTKTVATAFVVMSANDSVE